jgi:hypothetical protein
LEHDYDGQLTRDELAVQRLQLEGFGRDKVEIWVADHRLAPTAVEIILEEPGAIYLQITFDREAESQIKFRSAIKSLARAHRQYVSFVDERGNKLGEKMLDATVDEFQLNIGLPLSMSSDSSLSLLAWHRAHPNRL